MEEEKEGRQLELPPEEFGGEEEREEGTLTPKFKSTLRRRGGRRNYLPGIIPEKVNLDRLGQLLRALGREVTHQPELEGLEEKPEPEKENEV